MRVNIVRSRVFSPAISTTAKMATTKIVEKMLFAIVITVVAASLATQSHAQFTPLATGTATLDGAGSCPQSSGWLAGGTCKHYTISNCPYAQPLGVTINYVPASGTSKGTIVFFGGGPGTSANTDSGQEATFATAYLLAGFSSVQTAWDSDWENTDVPGDIGLPYVASILAAACRPATLMSAINGSSLYHPVGAMCAQGASAGGGGVAYALEWYGAKLYLNNVELTSGPTFSSILQGCRVPNFGAVTICGPNQYGCNNEYGNTQSWMNAPQYIDEALYLGSMQAWTSDDTCQNVPVGQQTSTLSNQAWLNMSIVNPAGGDFTFPTTSMAGWVCAGNRNNYQSGTCNVGSPSCPNNSGSQGALFHQQFSSGNRPKPHYAFTGISLCNGEEGVAGSQAVTPNGTLGVTAIQTDMEAHCTK